MSAPFVVVGGGGHAREVLDVADAIAAHGGQADVLGVVTETVADTELLAHRGVEVLGGLDVVRDGQLPYVIAIGAPAARRRIDAELSAAGCPSPVLVHPSATIGHDVELGPGSIVFPQASLTCNIRVGRHTHVNRGATIGHDCTIGSYVILAPLAAVSGRVEVADDVALGTGSVVIELVRIGARAVVGAGAAVVEDVDPDAVVVGVPARPKAAR